MTVHNLGRNTPWKTVQCWFPKWLEMRIEPMYADGIFEKSGWGATLEERSLALPNHGQIWVYRRLGSEWDPDEWKKKRPTPPPSKKPVRE